MKKKLLILTLLLLCISFFLPSSAFAHYEESDGNMTVTLHIDPNDNPIPGQKATIHFTFDDSTKKFQLQDCACAISISQEDKQIYEGSLIQQTNTKPSLWETTVPFVFPDRDTYTITLTGTPKTQHAFQPFSVSWDYEVNPDDFAGVVPEKPNDIAIIVGGLVAIIIAFSFFGWFLKKNVVDSDTKIHSQDRKKSIR